MVKLWFIPIKNSLEFLLSENLRINNEYYKLYVSPIVTHTQPRCALKSEMFAEDKMKRGKAPLKLLPQLYKVLVYRHLDTRLCVALCIKTAGLLMLRRTKPQPEKKNI